MTCEELKAKWLAKYGSDELVLAHALRTANRLQKVKKIGGFYALKDRWISKHQDHLAEGRVARVEIRECWSCDGEGYKYGNGNNYCDHCDGTGVFSSRTLYEHCFEVGGQRFVFHSYSAPKIVSKAKGQNLSFYGRPFTPDELPCPPQAVLVDLIKEMMGNGDDQKQ